jgi:hypothetical protein
VKHLPLLWRITLYCITTATVGAWFLVQNADDFCTMCYDHWHHGFPFPYINVGWAVPNRHALLWPGAIADAALILLVGFIFGEVIYQLLTMSRRDPRKRVSPK